MPFTEMIKLNIGAHFAPTPRCWRQVVSQLIVTIYRFLGGDLDRDLDLDLELESELLELECADWRRLARPLFLQQGLGERDTWPKGDSRLGILVLAASGSTLDGEASGVTRTELLKIFSSRGGGALLALLHILATGGHCVEGCRDTFLSKGSSMVLTVDCCGLMFKRSPPSEEDSFEGRQ